MASPYAAQILPSRAVIRLAGESSLDFLHNLLTCQLAAPIDAERGCRIIFPPGNLAAAIKHVVG